MMTIEEIRNQLLTKEINPETNTVEILNCSFIAEASVFGNPKAGKLKFYLEEDRPLGFDTNDVFLSFYQSPTQSYAHRMLGEENGHQWQNALNELKRDPHTRRAVAYYNAKDYLAHDRYCCTSAQLTVRNGLLDYLTVYRSNDLWNAYPLDYAWHHLLHRNALMELQTSHPSIQLGQMYWNAGSAHILAKDVEHVRNLWK
jgi:thymidylate synthase